MRLWEGTIDNNGERFHERNHPYSHEVVEFIPSTANHTGILVVYREGAREWSGRGQQHYYPARYTVHVVEECMQTSGAGYRVRFSTRHDLYPNLKKQRERRANQRNKQYNANMA